MIKNIYNLIHLVFLQKFCNIEVFFVIFKENETYYANCNLTSADLKNQSEIINFLSLAKNQFVEIIDSHEKDFISAKHSYMPD